MGNIISYVEETKDSFDVVPFHSVDSLVLSQLAYVYFDGLVFPPGEGVPVPLETLAQGESLEKITKSVRAGEENRQLIQHLVKSPRYEGLALSDYVNVIDEEKQEQFSAITFHLPGEGCYVAFRGTDGYYVAWKEDFNLAFICPVPSQLSAQAYLNQIAPHVRGKLWVGGHSKGGNLAVYAALFCEPEARAKIHRIYSHDGPGFQHHIFETPAFQEMRERMEKTMPECSLVGILLQHQEPYQVIESKSLWIMQHDPFNWVVEQGSFVYKEGLNATASFLDGSLNEWISSMSVEEMSSFSDALYQVLCAFGGDTFYDLSPQWSKTLPQVLEGLRGLDEKTVRCVLHTVGSLFSLALKNLSKPHLAPDSNSLLTLPDLPNLSKLLSLFHRPAAKTGEEEDAPPAPTTPDLPIPAQTI